MKTLFWVLGPESSGNRFFTRVLISAGCAGDGDHYQRWDDSNFKDAPDTDIVWRRSLPYGPVWPDLDQMLATVKAAGCMDVRVFWLFRNREPTIKSQLEKKYVKTELEAWKNIERAHFLIGKFIYRHDLPAQIVRYERIMRNPKYIEVLLGRWGLAIPELPEIKNGNTKWETGVPLVRPDFHQVFPVPGP